MKQILEENNEKKEISIDDEKSELSITSTSNQENEITTKDHTSISNEKFTPNLPPPAPPLPLNVFSKQLNRNGKISVAQTHDWKILSDNNLNHDFSNELLEKVKNPKLKPIKTCITKEQSSLEKEL